MLFYKFSMGFFFLIFTRMAFGEISPTFDDINARIFQTRCVSCHGGSEPVLGIDLSSYESIKNSNVFPPLIIPLQPDKSSLYRVVKSAKMPPGADKLVSEELEAIKVWIETGARLRDTDPIPTPLPAPTEPPD